MRKCLVRGYTRKIFWKEDIFFEEAISPLKFFFFKRRLQRGGKNSSAVGNELKVDIELSR